MRRSNVRVMLLLTLAGLFCFTQCSRKNISTGVEGKTTTNQGTGLNVILYNKPVDTIEFYIRGKWWLHYQFGGICGTCRFDREQYNEYYEFLPNSKTRYTYQNTLKVDTTYIWSSYQANPQDYVHHLITGPYHFEVEKIVNDTLVLDQPFRFNPDYMQYYLTKTN